MLTYARIFLPSQVFTVNLLYWQGWEFFIGDLVSSGFATLALCFYPGSSAVSYSQPSVSTNPTSLSSWPHGVGIACPCLIHIIFGLTCLMPDYNTTFPPACLHLKTERLSVTNVTVPVFRFTFPEGFGANQFILTPPGRGCSTGSRMWGYRNWRYSNLPSPFPHPLALF